MFLRDPHQSTWSRNNVNLSEKTKSSCGADWESFKNKQLVKGPLFHLMMENLRYECNKWKEEENYFPAFRLKNVCSSAYSRKQVNIVWDTAV